MTARLIFAALAWLALASGVAHADGPTPPSRVQTGHVELDLVSSQSAVAPGSIVYVALRQAIAPGWHTYWKNSGDAGQPTEITWTLPEGMTAGAPVWPTPKRLREATLMTYGYQGEVVMPVPVRIPAVAPPGVTLPLRAPGNS